MSEVRVQGPISQDCDLELLVARMLRHVEATDRRYRHLYVDGLHPVPIPFFGNPTSATVVTVGVNPSDGEFAAGRWSNTMAVGDLVARLKTYFEAPQTAPHGWFSKWNRALDHAGVRYEDGTAAHLDLSPRATRPWSQLEDKESFVSMLGEDVSFFFEILRHCRKAKLLMLAGYAHSNRPMNALVHEVGPTYGFELTPGAVAADPGDGDYPRTAFVWLASSGVVVQRRAE